jgi:hypothetical protein
MPTIKLDLDGDGAWEDLADRPKDQLIHLPAEAPIGMAVLDSGMISGKPSVALRFALPDGRVVIAETSLALLSASVRAIWARYGEPT